MIIFCKLSNTWMCDYYIEPTDNQLKWINSVNFSDTFWHCAFFEVNNTHIPQGWYIKMVEMSGSKCRQMWTYANYAPVVTSHYLYLFIYHIPTLKQAIPFQNHHKQKPTPLSWIVILQKNQWHNLPWNFKTCQQTPINRLVWLTFHHLPLEVLLPKISKHGKKKYSNTQITW